MKMYKLLFVAAACALCGCYHTSVERPAAGQKAEAAKIDSRLSATVQAYIDFCRETALRGKLESDWGDDWMVGAGVTTWEHNVRCKIVFANRQYLSFRIEEFLYDGGMHGNTKIIVGTFDRKSGRLLTAADLVPRVYRAVVVGALRQKIVKKVGGVGGLLGEVTLTDNCFVAKDGVHFVYNEYEVACYAVGALEFAVKCPQPAPLGR